MEELPISPVFQVHPSLNYYNQVDTVSPLVITSAPPAQIAHYISTDITNQAIALVPIAKKRGRSANSSHADASCVDDLSSGSLNRVESARVTSLCTRK